MKDGWNNHKKILNGCYFYQDPPRDMSTKKYSKRKKNL